MIDENQIEPMTPVQMHELALTVQRQLSAMDENLKVKMTELSNDSRSFLEYVQPFYISIYYKNKHEAFFEENITKQNLINAGKKLLETNYIQVGKACIDLIDEYVYINKEIKAKVLSIPSKTALTVEHETGDIATVDICDCYIKE